MTMSKDESWVWKSFIVAVVMIVALISLTDCCKASMEAHAKAYTACVTAGHSVAECNSVVIKW